jgi:hypothetical protein
VNGLKMASMDGATAAGGAQVQTLDVPSIFVAHSRRTRDRRETCSRSLATHFAAEPVWVSEDETRRDGWNVVLRARAARLTGGEVGIYRKQREILRRIAAAPLTHAMVFEDDPVFPPDFVPRFRSCWTARPSGWDLLFFGASCGLERPADQPGGLFAREIGTRSASAYMVTREAAAALARELAARPVRRQVDLEMNAVIRDLSLRVFWSCPALVENGSETGLYRRSVARPAWWRRLRHALAFHARG